MDRARYGAETAETTAGVAAPGARLRQGQAAALAAAGAALPVRGEAAAIHDAQGADVTTPAGRMADDRGREPGWAIGSGIVESAGKPRIAARERGPGMRWRDAGAPTVAAVRVLLLNDAGEDDDLAA